jgi:hypothetical protein
LFPSEVKGLGVKVVPLKAFVEKANQIFVIRILLKLKLSTVFHVFFELDGVSLAEFVQGRLQLFLLDVFVLFILIFSR